MPVVMASLIDVNVLIALLHARHTKSVQAVNWLERQAEPEAVLICRVVQMGALRILTNPKVMKNDAMSAGIFWRGWDSVLQDERFALVKEPETFEPVWRELTSKLPAGTSAETDAYLAALALAGDWQLATFDQGFTRFPKLALELIG